MILLSTRSSFFCWTIRAFRHSFIHWCCMISISCRINITNNMKSIEPIITLNAQMSVQQWWFLYDVYYLSQCVLLLTVWIQHYMWLICCFKLLLCDSLNGQLVGIALEFILKIDFYFEKKHDFYLKKSNEIINSHSINYYLKNKINCWIDFQNQRYFVFRL